MSIEKNLDDICDAIVMLTWSDWHTEPRSNRYHYAIRLSKWKPVIFVQSNKFLENKEFEIEETNDGITLLHLRESLSVTSSHEDSLSATNSINKALNILKIKDPLLWIYNIFYKDFIFSRAYSFKVYHATEDYFGGIFCDTNENTSSFLQNIKAVINKVDLLITVSEPVLYSFINNGGYKGNSIVLENACDFNFYRPTPSESSQMSLQHRFSSNNKSILHQGGINLKTDIDLFEYLITTMKEYTFWFCGPIPEDPNNEAIANKFKKIIKENNNANYLGNLTPEGVRLLCYLSSVGIIVYDKSLNWTKNTFPLKAFEYLATGLPVVSTRISSLEKHSHVIDIADTKEEFKEKIINLSKQTTQEDFHTRVKAASAHNYDINFDKLKKLLPSVYQKSKAPHKNYQANVLIIYDEHYIHPRAVSDHLYSFAKFSNHNIYYHPATRDRVCEFDLSYFDVLIVHYTVRLAYPDHISPSFANEISRFQGYKILFIQDEYDTTNTAKAWMRSLRINTVFTCVPEKYIQDVYPSDEVPGIKFIQNLTGYVPEIANNFHLSLKKTKDRTLYIAHRGRSVGFHYGDLGQEKMNIGIEMNKAIAKYMLKVDISSREEDRIYGDDWYKFLASSKATLGTESGFNVFDFDGKIKANVEAMLNENPHVSYQEVFEKLIAPHEGRIKMNQISPRIFEAIMLKTVLILYEGKYSNVIKPDIHFIPLKKDFSNINDVVSKLNDDRYLQEMADRAYQDIILSGEYSYSKFVNMVDQEIYALSFVNSRRINHPSLLAQWMKFFPEDLLHKPVVTSPTSCPEDMQEPVPTETETETETETQTQTQTQTQIIYKEPQSGAITKYLNMSYQKTRLLIIRTMPTWFVKIMVLCKKILIALGVRNYISPKI